MPVVRWREVASGMLTTRARAVELDRLAELAGRRPGAVRDRAVVPVARGVGDRRPRALVEAVRRDETQRCGRCRGRGSVRVRPEVAGSVRGSDAVAVARRGGNRRVLVDEAGRCGDLREVVTAGAAATLDPVPGDADVVGRGTPAEIDLAGARGTRRKSSRLRRRLVVQRRGGSAGGVGVGAEVAGGVRGPDAIGVARRGGDRGVIERRFR